MAESVNKSIIIDVVVKNDEAIANIAEAKREIAALQAANKDLAKSEDDQSKAIAANMEQIKALNKVIAANSKEVQTNIQQRKQQEGSLKQMRAELKNTLSAYDALSAAERNGAKGKEMLKHIQDLTDGLRQAEFESGRFQMNVGNYPGLFGQVGAKANLFANAIQSITGGAKNVGTAMLNAGKSVAMFGKQLLVLITNPVVAIIALIALVIMKVVDAFKKSDEAMTTLQRAFASFQPILTAVGKAFEFLANIVAKVVEGFMSNLTAVLRLIPAFRDAQEAAMGLVDAEDALEEADRAYTVSHAENQREIARLRAESADKERTTAAQRIKNLKEAQDIERKDAAEAKRLAEERLRIAEAKMKQDNDTSDAAADNIAQLRAAAIQADTEYYAVQRKLQKEYSKFVAEEQKAAEEEEKKRKEAAKKAAEDAKQRRRTELSENRAAEDLQLAILADGIAKEEAVLRTAFARKVEDLKARLADEKNLTKEAREAINRQIILTEAQLQVELGKLQEQASADNLNRLKAAYQMRLELAGKDIDERERLTLQQLERERKQARAAAEKEGQDVALVSDFYDKKIADAKKEAAAERRAVLKQQAANEVAELENNYNRELQALGDSEAAKLQLQADYAQTRLDRLRAEYEAVSALNEQQAAEQYGSVEAWKAAVLNADKEVIAANAQVMESQKAVTEHQQQQTMEVAKSFQSIGGCIQGIFDTLAETDERYSDFATAMALTNIITSSAISIAAAIQAATQAGAFTGLAAPATIPAFIAELVGIVASGITSAITTLNKAKQARSQAKYAEGGVVGGTYTGQEDTVTARLTPGEFVVKRSAVRDNLPALLAINGGWGNTARGGRFAAGGVAGVDDLIRGYQTDTLRATVQEAVATIQPVVSVKEITRVASRVQVKEQLSKY